MAAAPGSRLQASVRIPGAERRWRHEVDAQGRAQLQAARARGRAQAAASPPPEVSLRAGLNAAPNAGEVAAATTQAPATPGWRRAGRTLAGAAAACGRASLKAGKTLLQLLLLPVQLFLAGLSLAEEALETLLVGAQSLAERLAALRAEAPAVAAPAAAPRPTPAPPRPPTPAPVQATAPPPPAAPASGNVAADLGGSVDAEEEGSDSADDLSAADSSGDAPASDDLAGSAASDAGSSASQTPPPSPPPSPAPARMNDVAAALARVHGLWPRLAAGSTHISMPPLTDAELGDVLLWLRYRGDAQGPALPWLNASLGGAAAVGLSRALRARADFGPRPTAHWRGLPRVRAGWRDGRVPLPTGAATAAGELVVIDVHLPRWPLGRRVFVRLQPCGADTAFHRLEQAPQDVPEGWLRSFGRAAQGEPDAAARLREARLLGVQAMLPALVRWRAAAPSENSAPALWAQRAQTRAALYDTLNALATPTLRVGEEWLATLP